MKWLRFVALSAIVATAGSHAKADSGEHASRSELAVAIRRAADLASLLESELRARFSVPEGWHCEDGYQKDLVSGPLQALPVFSQICRKDIHEIRVSLILDASSAELLCRSVEATQAGISAGRIQPELYRFFASGSWVLMRASVDIAGCSHGGLALMARGSRSRDAINAGPGLVDEFAEALIAFDIADIPESKTFSRHRDAMNTVVRLLATQSAALGEIISSDKFGEQTRFVRSPNSTGPQNSDLPFTTDLAFSPRASSDLLVNGCKVFVELSAAEASVREAKTIGRWARPGGEDGKINHAYIRRNTERFVGRERVDGTGIEVFVDDRVIVRVVLPGAKPCESNPDIVRELFAEILQNHFGSFGFD